MSLKRTAILLAVSHANHPTTNHSVWNSLASGSSPQHNSSDFYTATNFNGNYSKNYNNQGMRVMRPGVGGFHGNVNILLGGATLICITTIVCLICYCCHRKIKMRSSTSSLYRDQRWMDNDPSMEIYSVEQYFDTSGLYSEADNMPTMTVINNEPPPSYDCVMALDEVISRKRKNLYTFKVFHHHPGHAVKECIVNEIGNVSPHTIPQVSLEETNCDIQSPSSAASLCNCNCVINQNFTTNLCASCNNVIDNGDNTNNNILCPAALITGSNLLQDNCTGIDTGRPVRTGEIDLLVDQLNNIDYNGNNRQLDSIASPSTSTSTHYMSCIVVSSSEQQQQRQNDTEDDDDDEINGNGSCHRQLERANLNTINGNGLIRLDMSQIIDQTGLPTYEAALKLKSSGYV